MSANGGYKSNVIAYSTPVNYRLIRERAIRFLMSKDKLGNTTFSALTIEAKYRRMARFRWWDFRCLTAHSTGWDDRHGRIEAVLDVLKAESCSLELQQMSRISQKSKRVLINAFHDINSFAHDVDGSPEFSSMWRQSPRIASFKRWLNNNSLNLVADGASLSRDDPWHDDVVNKLLEFGRQLRRPDFVKFQSNWDRAATRACGRWKKVLRGLLQQHYRVFYGQAILCLGKGGATRAEISLEVLSVCVQKFVKRLRSPSDPRVCLFFGYFCKLDWSPARGYFAHFILLADVEVEEHFKQTYLEVLQPHWAAAASGWESTLTQQGLPFQDSFLPVDGFIGHGSARDTEKFEGWLIEGLTLSTQQFRVSGPRNGKLLLAGRLREAPRRRLRQSLMTDELRMVARWERASSPPRFSYTLEGLTLQKHLSLYRTAVIEWCDAPSRGRGPAFQVVRVNGSLQLKCTNEATEMLHLLRATWELADKFSGLTKEDPRVFLFIGQYRQYFGEDLYDRANWSLHAPRKAAKLFNMWRNQFRNALSRRAVARPVALERDHRKSLYSFLLDFINPITGGHHPAFLQQVEVRVSCGNTPFAAQAQHKTFKKFSNAMRLWSSHAPKQYGIEGLRMAWRICADPFSTDLIAVLLLVNAKPIGELLETLKCYEHPSVHSPGGINLNAIATWTVARQASVFNFTRSSKPSDWLMSAAAIHRRLAYLAWADEYDRLSTELKGRSLGTYPPSARLTRLWADRPRHDRLQFGSPA